MAVKFRSKWFLHDPDETTSGAYLRDGEERQRRDPAVGGGECVQPQHLPDGGSDNPMVQHTGHRDFEKLLKCGVRLFDYLHTLFDYLHTLLHQKIMTVDGVWCAIGSSNFDDRSFESNDEISLSILDSALAERLDAIFEKYVQRADGTQLEAWQRRGWVHKMKGNSYYLLNELL